MKKTVMIVDDSRIERAILSDYLKDEYELIQASSGEEAISFLQEKYMIVAAIVMDVIMPKMNGFETLKCIKDNENWRTIPIIITTGLEDENSRERAIISGADNFIIKPINRQLLLYILHNTIKLRETAAIVDAMQRDRLTELLKRESFFVEAERMIQRREEGYFILSCLDIENFKIINDLYGTDIGDDVLRYIARLLSDFATLKNGLAGRNMGDKFVVLFPSEYQNTKEIEEYIEKMSHPPMIAQRIRIRDGRYLVNDKLLSINAMFDRAAMAEASIKGRFDVTSAYYEESMRINLLKEQNIINNMVSALKNKEFEVWYQPQYNHINGALVGSEALVRWRKNGKIISPGEFISIFEKNGFIYQVDQFVWREVCIALCHWLDEGLNPLPVSVNISRYDILQEDFVNIITSMVKEYDISPTLLRLEVTESAFSISSSLMVNVIKKLIEAGFTVEIDDFGTGFSSLNTLKDVPATILKLDMKFFENTENYHRAGNIIESVVRMAKWIGMSVIAEGVEEKTQADYLKSIGCNYIQGFYYSRPVPKEEFETIFKNSTLESEMVSLKTLDLIDTNGFWNPKSMEMLIFNSYAGAACIVELSTYHVEILRATEFFVKILDSKTMGTEDVLRLDWKSHMSPKSGGQFTDAVRDSSKSGEIVYGEIEFLNLPGCRNKTILRYGLRVIASTDDRYLVYCISENITAQRETERQKLQFASQLSAIMRYINVSVSAFTLNEKNRVKLIFGNDNYYAIFGYNRAEARRKGITTLSCIVKEDYDKVLEKMNQLKRDGIPTTLEYHAMKKDGTILLLRANASLMQMEGHGKQIIVLVETEVDHSK